MKKISAYLIVAALLLACADADRHTDLLQLSSYKNQTQENSASIDFKDLNELMEEMGMPAQKFEILSDKRQVLKGKSGTEIYYEPGKLVAKSGAPVGKTIEVELKELVSRKHLLQESAQTVSNGKLLVSGGSYFIKMTSNGEELFIKEGESLSVVFPKIAEEKMSLFYGTRDSLGRMNWGQAGENFGNKAAQIISQPTKIEPKRDTPEVKRTPPAIENEKDDLMALDETPSESFPSNTNTSASEVSMPVAMPLILTGSIDSNGNTTLSAYSVGGMPPKKEMERQQKTNELIYQMDKVKTGLYGAIALKSLGWINCDRFYGISERGDFRVSTAPEDSISYVNLYLVFKRINSVLQSAYSDGKLLQGTNGFQNIPVGEEVRLIAYTVKRGKILAQSWDFVTSKSSGFRLTLKEIQENNLKKLLEGV